MHAIFRLLGAMALEGARPIQFPDNVELVKRYYDRIQAALE